MTVQVTAGFGLVQVVQAPGLPERNPRSIQSNCVLSLPWSRTHLRASVPE
ncbi:hypothetical protein GCM10009530_73680 [Microbispora corallina]|uniref:Uncharacterized protein n=1 Tax=Microbispora corallina TaxID=83302 RepID=A0ABQ4GAW4_9ACTN|nr:hypothetical protein Mco01_72310 [Microbispora corallina]